jgi:hypothetical protein
VDRLKQRLAGLRLPQAAHPLLLLLLCLAGYGLFAPWQGFYWDSWVMIWIAEKLGSAGLARYFATNRPIWGLIYQLTTRLLGSDPLAWQFFGIFWRWACVASLWWFMRLAWPNQPRLAAWTSALAAVYTGFNQQANALLYGHFFIVQTSLHLSLAFSLLALRRPKWRSLLTIAGMAASLLNLVTMEYFFLLELLRPLLHWAAVEDQCLPWRKRLGRAVTTSLPYLLLFLAAVVWRAFFFPYTTNNYQMSLLDQLRAAPVQTVLVLVLTVLADMVKVTLGAWHSAIQLPNMAVEGTRTTILYAAGALLAMFASLFVFCRTRSDEPGLHWKGSWLVVGLAGVFLAGWPFWLTRNPVAFTIPNSRFVLPFIFGACLIAAGLLLSVKIPEPVRLALVVLLIGLATGRQVLNTSDYRRDWNNQSRFLWQLAWRIPYLEPGTVLIANELPTVSSDNSLTAAINWMYAPDYQGGDMPYMLYYPTIRVGLAIQALQPGLTIEQKYLTTQFTGSTDQVVVLTYEPPDCLRVLDERNKMLPLFLNDRMRQAAALSKSEWIRADGSGRGLAKPMNFLGAEPAHGWCYYVQKADLAAQQGDWQLVAELGDKAYALGDTPSNPVERLVFIEGYAHAGRWEDAADHSQKAASISPMMLPRLCILWQRIGQEQEPSDSATNTIQSMLDAYCTQ